MWNNPTVNLNKQVVGNRCEDIFRYTKPHHPRIISAIRMPTSLVVLQLYSTFFYVLIILAKKEVLILRCETLYKVD